MICITYNLDVRWGSTKNGRLVAKLFAHADSPFSPLAALPPHLCDHTHPPIRDWSLITWSGGYKTGGGGAHEVLPIRKGGAEKVLAMLKGGGTKSFGVVFTR